MRYYAPTKLSENIRETPEGYLVCVGVSVARIGEMMYRPGEVPITPGPDGKIVIVRDEKEVFSPATIASFEGKPVTIGHPDDFVNPENWKELTCGTMTNVRRGEGDFATDLISDLLITDGLAIQMVKDGLREVSCGYEAEYEQLEVGRGTQLGIIGNHLALVEQGRAGVAYAINDQKGKAKAMTDKVKNKIRALLTKTADEACASLDEGVAGEGKEQKGDKSIAFDSLVQMVKDMGAKLDALGSKTISGDEKKPGDESKVVSGDEDPAVVAAAPAAEAESGLAAFEARLKKVEELLASLVEDESEEESEAEVMDEDGEEGEEVEDEAEEKDDEKKSKTGDAASRIEILAPGQKGFSKKQALTHAYKTTDGKRVIDQLTGGKAPTFDSAEQTDMLFVAASELLRSDREDELASTKRTRDFLPTIGARPGVMTPEKMNEMNAARYGLKK